MDLAEPLALWTRRGLAARQDHVPAVANGTEHAGWLPLGERRAVVGHEGPRPVVERDVRADRADARVAKLAEDHAGVSRLSPALVAGGDGWLELGKLPG